ncbi:MAG TPA: helix-turn-helix domain-containing protein [Pseudonocardiaceae bacterium]|jgi:excisionase family DNA binding protein|nr:helix-turn-helix domain-containing protein [Pseudonocardiaceae bacterium]
MSTALREQTVLPPDDQDAAADLAELLRVTSAAGPATLTGSDGSRAQLPEAVCRLLHDVVQAMSQGMAITVAPHNTLLTTQEAADLLGVSRPTLVRLLEAGEIPHSTRGRHRRVRLVDLVEYQRATTVAREAALDEMAEDAGEAGLYDATTDPLPPR